MIPPKSRLIIFVNPLYQSVAYESLLIPYAIRQNLHQNTYVL